MPSPAETSVQAKLTSAAVVASFLLLAGCEAVPVTVWSAARQSRMRAPGEPSGAAAPGAVEVEESPAPAASKSAPAHAPGPAPGG